MWDITDLTGGKKEKRENQQLQNTTIHTVLKVRRNTKTGEKEHKCWTAQI